MRKVAFRLIVAACAGFLSVSSPDTIHVQNRPATAGSPAATGEGAVTDMLQRMHAFLTAQDVKFDTQFSANDAVLGTRLSGRTRFAIRQPNLFRVEVEAGGRSDLFVSDGQSLWIQRGNRFAQFSAKDSVLGTMYAATGMMFTPTRILDAFWTVDYLEKLNEDVQTKSVPAVTLAGRTCPGVRVTRFEDQFDLWIDAAPPHRPCKLISRRTDGSSQSISTHIFTWHDAKALPPDTFRFTPRKGATRTHGFDPL